MLLLYFFNYKLSTKWKDYDFCHIFFLESLKIVRRKIIVVYSCEVTSNILIVSMTSHISIWCLPGIDKCNENVKNNCSHLCINSLGSYYCHCLNGFLMSQNNKTCRLALSQISMNVFRKLKTTAAIRVSIVQEVTIVIVQLDSNSHKTRRLVNVQKVSGSRSKGQCAWVYK